MADAAAFFDLDRTLLQGASGPLISAAFRERGLLRSEPLPGERLLFGLFNAIGETLPAIALTRSSVRAAKGWDVADVRAAGEAVAETLSDAVEPFAREVIADHRAAGRKLVLATTTPYDVVKPFADLLGFDDVLATRYRVDGAKYDGSIDGEFVWSRGKARSAKAWSRSRSIELADSYAYSDSIFDVPLLSLVGHPVAVNPDPRLFVFATVRRWETVWFSAPPGVPKPLGIEPADLLNQLVRPEFLPWLQIDLEGLEHVPAEGGALLAANHRSYVDPLVVNQVGARVARPIRFLAKKEVTDAPIVGQITRTLGAIRVDREGGGAESMDAAARALRAGELVAVFPQGTIPRGPAFFESRLEGRHGAVRLAIESEKPIIPVGLWGTEKAWPRNRRVPYLLNVADPPRVRVRIGEPYTPSSDDAATATTELMERIAALLPDEARTQTNPTEADLAATYPAGEEHDGNQKVLWRRLITQGHGQPTPNRKRCASEVS
ncbi:MAG: putative phosphoserine phosphatase/1-acylglycerol-3-phosphate O-acyltransferase [Acidimicrobiales bacterium]|jgi:putative phosphoserine phosphatase/1-acylglycerol-3-phosphate O-acyltransferase